jgi:subtilisin family serine protease
MMRRRKWLWLSLALVCVLGLGVTLLSGGDGRQLPLSGQSMAASGKLGPGLASLCQTYDVLGLRRLEGKKFAINDVKNMIANNSARRGALLAYLKMTASPGTKAVNREGKEITLSGRKNTDRRFQRASLIDPAIQKLWGNPDFDVVRAGLVTRSDPRRLDSAYLKVRQARQEGDSWKAYCEVAVFKAAEIAQDAEIVRIELLPPTELHNDLGTASTGAPRLRLGKPGGWRVDKGYTGEGVLVGDVDTGIDWTHGDFLNPDGTTRILYLWDISVTTPGKTPQDLFGMTGFNVGTVWTKAEIDAGFCTEIDDGAHGTHTIGTAAGNGGATGLYTGMAPNADIIFVKGLYLEGNEFCYEIARRLGRPIAVNNSFGAGDPFFWGAYMGYVNDYPGDGSDYDSQYYDWLASEYPTGAVIGKSAGNNGMWHTYTDHDNYGFALYDGSLHFGGTSRQGQATEHVYDQKWHENDWGKYEEYNDFMIRSDVPVRVTVWVDDTHSYVMDTGTFGEIDTANDFSYDTFYQLMTTDPYNGEYTGIMWFDQWDYYGWGLPYGEWKFTVEPLNAGDTAHYDVWAYSYVEWILLPYIYNYYDSCFTTHSSHDEYQLDYSAAKSVITTGSWTTRSSYHAADGNTYYPWGFMEPRKGTITYFSSPGPARDGRMKPDIAAPGAAIISAASKDGGWVPSDLDPDLAHGWMWGTSMAAPHVTGAAALVLQKYPHSTMGSVRGMLKRWARNDAQTAAIGPNGFGAGKLNVLPLNNLPVAMLSASPAEIVLEEFTGSTCSGAASHDPEGFPLTYAFSLISAPTGANATITASGDHAALKVDADIEGTYQVGLVVNDGIADSEMAVATVVAKFYPVLPASGFALQRLESDLIFSKEYINHLTWQANTANRVIVSGYKLYRKAKGAADGAYQLLQQLSSTSFSYDDRGLAAAQMYTYKLTTIDSRGRESDPVVAGN